MRTIALLVTLCLFTPSVAWADEDVPLAKGSVVPFTGILLTPDAYALTVKEKSELEKLKTKSATTEELLKFKETKYEELLALKAKEVEAWRLQAEKNAERTWWDENKLQVGVLLGIATTIAVTFAVAETLKVAR